MRERGREFAEVLAEAQELGYAEADPSLRHRRHRRRAQAGDPGGARLRPAGRLSTRCMSRASARVSALDIAFAGELGYRIKLLGIARADRRRASRRACIPAWCRSPRRSRAWTACSTRWWRRATSSAGSCWRAAAPGQGRPPRAVVADLIDMARGRHHAGLGRRGGGAVERAVGADERACRRLLPAADGGGPSRRDRRRHRRAARPRRQSLESMLQRGRAPGEAVPVVLVTHETRRAAMRAALDADRRVGRGAGEAGADPDRAGVIRHEGVGPTGS